MRKLDNKGQGMIGAGIAVIIGILTFVLCYYVGMIFIQPIFDLLFPTLVNGGTYGLTAKTMFEIVWYIGVPFVALLFPFMVLNRMQGGQSGY